MMIKWKISQWHWRQKIAFAFLPPFLAGGLGSILTVEGLRSWYPMINKVSFNPPAWVFGPVWTMLYIFMGTATVIILQTKGKIFALKSKNLHEQALNLYLGQIVLNFLWTPVFFALAQPLLALFILVTLLIVFVQMTSVYARINKNTLWFLIPNILWLCLATMLNFGVVILN